MLSNIGFYLLFLCAITTGYGFLASVAAARLRHRRLYLSAKMALTSTMVLAVIASGVLMYSLFARDFSIAYVMKNSSTDLPALYTFTAFWSSLEGSHMLWTLLLTILATVAVWTHAKDNEHIMPYVSAALQIVLCWMYYLAVSYSDPFARSIPAPPDGRGMNELLQNIYMASHPPLLFLGYTALAIPFAYSIAALAYGDITEGWLKTCRRWTLFAWCFLTAAITLGGRWAYVELGWAGYWAWDPVENSSFLPWLLSTASLHSLLVQEKLGHLKRLTLVLAIASFFMCYFGTFITRSGVVSSVHSFAESPIGPNYLAFLAALAFGSSLLYALRAPSILPSETEKVWGISKESALVVTQFLLLSFAAIVFIGTIFPIVSEAITGQRISIQAPYFNAFAPYMGLGVIVAIAIGNLMRYQTAKMPGAKGVILWSIAAAIPLTMLLIHFGDVMLTTNRRALISQIVGMYLSSWCISCLVGDFYLKLKDLRFNWSLMFKNNLAYVGAFIAHVGMIIAIIGFLGNYRGMEKKVSLSVGDKTELYGYEFELERGIETLQVHNYVLYRSSLKMSRYGKELEEIHPAQSKYPTKPGQTFNEIAVHSTLWHDVYIVLADFDSKDGKRVTLKININPTVRFVWIAITIMVIGGLIALFDQRRGNRSRDVLAGRWETGGAV